jgi:hypothetical protein
MRLMNPELNESLCLFAELIINENISNKYLSGGYHAR